MSQSLTYPMGFYVLWIFGIAVLSLRTRIGAVKSGEISVKHFESFSHGTAPVRMIILGRHFDNQFQVPLLFFMTGLMHVSLNVVTDTVILLSWVFVASRCLHTFIHLGSNKVSHRLVSYLVGWIILIVMWVRLILI